MALIGDEAKITFDNTARSIQSFFWTIRQLEDIEGLSEQYETKEIKRISNFTMHTYEPLIFLKVIVMELILKQLHFLETNTWETHHNSKNIFSNLENSDKIYIENEYKNFIKDFNLEDSGFEFLDFNKFIDINKDFIRDLKYGEGLYMKNLILYPSNKFYKTIITNLIIPKYNIYKTTIS